MEVIIIKNKKIPLILVSLFILFLTISTVSAVEDTNIVNDTQDLEDNTVSNIVYTSNLLVKAEAPSDAIYVDGNLENDGDGSSTTPFNNLKSALNNASEGSTIIIKNGVYTGEENIGLTISTASLTIQAETTGEVVFDGEYTSQIFTVAKAAKSLTLNGLTFTHGNGTKGGAINWKAQSGIINECTFISNIATYGGAVYFTDNAKSEKITKSKFTNNTAISILGRGGALYFEDEGNGKNSITDSTFTGNTATKSGGAIFWDDDDGSNTISNCIFNKNSATSDSSFGGAIHYVCDDLTLEDSNFTENTASYGGALYINGYNSNIDNCNFISNNASSAGAISIYGSKTTISNSLFQNNKANTGSAIQNGYTSTVLTSNTFTDNQAESKSLSILKTNNQYTVTLTGGDNLLNAIYNTVNTITIDGEVSVNGAENSENGALLYQDSRISGESVTLQAYDGDSLVGTYTGVTDIYGNIYYTVSANKLIAIYAESSLYTGITSTYSEGNTYTDLLNLITASILNGITDINLTHSYTYNPSTDSSFPVTGIEIPEGVSINGNGATLNGGNSVRLFNIKGDNVSISNLNIINHVSNTSGGAIYWNGANGKITNVTFRNNKVTSSSASGGALYINNVGTTIEDSSFISNSANFTGAALYINSENTTLKNSNFTSNTGRATIYWGGNNGIVENIKVTSSSNIGLYWTGNTGKLRNSVFTNNNATGSGGAVYWIGTYGELTSNTFQSNNAESMGGALYISGDNSKIQSNTFTSNKASTYGGAIYSSADNITISSNSFNLNTGNIRGGGLYLTGNTTLNSNTANSNSEYAYITSEKVSTLKISIEDSPINVNQGSTVNINVKVTDDNNNPISGTSVKLSINNLTYTTGQLINGSASCYYVTSTPGTIPVTGSFASNTATGYLIVSERFYMTISTNGTLNVGNQVTVNVNINDPNSTNPTGLVTLYLNGTNYGSTNAQNGIASFLISLPSTSGTYNLTATYNDGTELKSSSRNLIVSSNTNTGPGGQGGPGGPGGQGRPGDNPFNQATQTVLNCDNYTQIESLSNGGYYTGKLVDTNGNNVIGQHITLTLTRASSGASKTYDVVTDYNGEYSLQINLGAGEYTIQAKYDGLRTDNLNYASSQSNIASIIVTKGTPVILSVSDYTSTYPGDGVFNKDFTGYLTYSNGTALIGRHVSLTLTRLSSGASKTYDTVSDYTGEFTLQIMLAPGDYSVVCSFADDGFQSTSETVTMTITR